MTDEGKKYISAWEARQPFVAAEREALRRLLLNAESDQAREYAQQKLDELNRLELWGRTP